MKTNELNEKYKKMIENNIELLRSNPEFNTGSLVWWYSESLDSMNPCRMGVVPDLGVDDWELIVVSQDLEYYLPNDSPRDILKGVKRRSGRYPWVNGKKDSKTNKFEILYKAGVIGWVTIALLLSVSAVGNIYSLQKQVRDMDNDISKLEKSNAELKKNFSTLVKWNNQLDANDTKNALYTQQRFAAVYEKIGLQ